MKIIQKVLSHGLLIAFFVAVFFIYLYRGELFPQWFDKQAQTEVTPSESAGEQSPAISTQVPQPEQFADADDGQAVAPASTEPVVKTVEQPPVAESPSAAVPVGAAAPAQTEAMPAVPAAEEQPAEPVTQTAGAATAPQYRPLAPGEAAKEAYNPVAEAPASVITAPEYRPLKAEKTAPPDTAAERAIPAAVPADSGAAGASDFQSRLEQARQHYWRGDIHAAEQAYLRLIDTYPEQAEVWGELGNLYFGQREMVQASDAYYRAIELLIEQGDAERARQLLGAMYQLDAEKANELETRLSRAGG